MSFVATIFEKLRARPDKAVLIEMRKGEAAPFTAEALLEKIGRARGFLNSKGIKKGERVGLLAGNSASWAAVDLAILAEGAIVVPLYARQDPRELAGMLKDAEASLVLAADAALKAKLAEHWDGAIAAFDEVLSQAEARDEPLCELAPEDIVTIIYTSGTSGEPKGVLTSRANADFMIPTTVAALKELYGERPGDDKAFHYLPFCFAGSRIMLWTQLYRNNPLSMSTNLDDLKDELGGADPNYYLNVPALLERIRRGVNEALAKTGGWKNALYRRGQAAYQKTLEGKAGLGDKLMLKAASIVFKGIKQKVGPSLEFLICGSAPLSDETQRWFEMIGVPVYQVYGLTETTAIVTMDKPGKIEPGKVGHAIEGCELKLSEDGELLCRGPNIFPGYWKRPEQTAAALTEDGWLRTGDLAEEDGSGNWKMIGRAKNLVIPASGHNIAPEPLEQALREACEQVEQAVVVGNGRSYLSVIVTGAADDTLIEKALARVNSDLPHYRQMRKYVRSPEPFTPENGLLTANQKLRRKVIEERFAAEIEELYR